ncbi:MAG: glycoside hydrolase family 127 protein [Bacteroidales bacterium]|nr:glycoside hydrolase family 127 protein [Bacteroidales bacterium]
MTNRKKRLIQLLGMIMVIIPGMLQLKAQVYDYPIQPVPFTSVAIEDSFWSPKIKTNHDVTIPHGFEQSANRILNFEIAAGIKTGSFASSYPFDDTDIYKMIEGASYSLYYFPDAELEKYIDSLILIVGMAQEDDGYLYTNRTIANINGTQPHSWAGNTRWVNVHELSHELYNLGHLFESAVAYFQATGKSSLLDIAVKAADRIDQDFGWGKIENYPGHQIVEAGLARLYRATGETRYLDLAKFFLDVRGPGGEEYCQAHERVVDQTEAVGHSVRAVYMYAGMADIAALKNDPSYIAAIDKIWEDIVQKKIYVTGGIGASGGNEGFSLAYNLPNSSAYCETCASIGNVYLNQRLFLLHGDAKYIDVLERTLYNALLSGVSLSGNRFFYPNPLLSNGSHQRSAWFGCACCPPNITRLIPSVPGYFYAVAADTLFVNLFARNSASVDLQGNTIGITQNTNYPWEGDVKITVSPATETTFTLLVRIPGWARNEAIPGGIYQFYENDPSAVIITLNGEIINPELKKGYAVITRTWKPGDVVSLTLPMKARKLIADERIAEDRQRIAIQRGPIVFCAEGVDNDGEVLTLNYDKDEVLEAVFDSSLLEGTEVIQTHAIHASGEQGRAIKLIPYHLWNNRGQSEMQVWLSVREPKIIPDSLILIDENAGDLATTNHVSPWESLNSIYDLYDPQNSGDKGPGAFGNWMYDGGTVGTWNWVQYNFHETMNISTSEVYWWDDNQGITLPDSCYLSYWDASSNTFKMIPGTACGKQSGCILFDQYNSVHFNTVTTNQIRLNFIGYQKAQGILEWSVFSPGNPSIIKPEEKNEDAIVMVFPNPTDDTVNIQIEKNTQATVSIYNSQGNLVYQDTIEEKTSIEKSRIGASGVYLVVIKSPQSEYINKILIQ